MIPIRCDGPACPRTAGCATQTTSGRVNNATGGDAESIVHGEESEREEDGAALLRSFTFRKKFSERGRPLGCVQLRYVYLVYVMPSPS